MACIDEDSGSVRGTCGTMPTSWFRPSSVNSNLEGKLPVHSVGITSGPLCASECVIMCVCVFVMVEWRVEDNPDEETVTRCHVMGGSEHNGHLKKKVNNINPCWYSPLHPACCCDPSPTHTESHSPTWALYSHIMTHHLGPAVFTFCLNPTEHEGLHPVTPETRIIIISIFWRL